MAPHSYMYIVKKKSFLCFLMICYTEKNFFYVLFIEYGLIG